MATKTKKPKAELYCPFLAGDMTSAGANPIPCPALEIGCARNPNVQPEGNTAAGGILFVLGPVTWKEDKANAPFEREAATLMRQAITSAGIPFDKCTFVNSCRCNPAGQKPLAKVGNLCVKKHLLPFIDDLQPALVVSCGALALKAISGKALKITEEAGFRLPASLVAAPVLPIISPSNVLYNPAANMPTLVQHMELVKEELEKIQGFAMVKKVYRKTVTYPKSSADYHIVLTFLKMLKDISTDGTYLSYDVETNGLDPYAKNRQANILTLSISWTPFDALVIPFRHPGFAWEPEQERVISEKLRELLTETPTVVKVAQNMKFDNKWMLRYFGWYPTANERIGELPGCFDTMLAHSLIDVEASHSLNALTIRYAKEVYGRYWDQTAEMAKTNSTATRKVEKRAMTEAEKREQNENRVDYSLVSYPVLAEYNGYDTMVPLYLIENILVKELQRIPGLLEHFRTVMMPASQALQDMECAGMPIDMPTLKKMTLEAETEMQMLGAELQAIPELANFQTTELGGAQINFKSVKQKQQLFYDHWHLPELKKTKSGGLATDKKVITLFLRDPRVPDYAKKVMRLMSELSKATTAYNSFLSPVPGRLGVDGMIRCSYKLHQARTGRLSSAQPNLQNQPKKIRAIYRSRFENGLILSADYSQLESRVMACFCKDQTFMDIFINGQDFHIMNAALMLGKDPGAAIKSGPNEDWGAVTKDDRQLAKGAVTFGLAYGRSIEALAEGLDIPESEAQTMSDTYFNNLPGLPLWIEAVKAQAKIDGFVRTASGRIRYIPDLTSSRPHLVASGERKAVNTIVQGTASDMTLSAIVRINEALKAGGYFSKLVVTVHDSIGVDCPPEEAQAVGELMVTIMQDVSMYDWTGPIPFPVEITANRLWDA